MPACGINAMPTRMKNTEQARETDRESVRALMGRNDSSYHRVVVLQGVLRNSQIVLLLRVLFARTMFQLPRNYTVLLRRVKDDTGSSSLRNRTTLFFVYLES